MILYADASCLLKLYLQEAESARVAEIIESARVVVTSAVAYVEMRAALSRALRDRRLNPGGHAAALDALEQRWPTLTAIAVTDDLLRIAARSAEKHSLKTLDAIHLASALESSKVAGSGFRFSAYDSDLIAAAQTEGLVVAP